MIYQDPDLWLAMDRLIGRANESEFWRARWRLATEAIAGAMAHTERGCSFCGRLRGHLEACPGVAALRGHLCSCGAIQDGPGLCTVCREEAL